jgi:hypothetical protein
MNTMLFNDDLGFSRIMALFLTPLEKAVKNALLPIEWATNGEATYEEVMKFFIAHKNDNTLIVKGVLLKEDTQDGHTLLAQLFLDNKNKVVCNKDGMPIGRRLKITVLDDELRSVFKSTNAIIVD